MEVSRLEVWFSLNWIENGNKHVAFRISSVNCITNSLCAVYQISPRNTLYRWWLKYQGLKKITVTYKAVFWKESQTVWNSVPGKCLNPSSIKILRILLYLTLLSKSIGIDSHWCSDIVFDTAFPLPSSPLKLSGAFQDKGLWETPSKS